VSTTLATDQQKVEEHRLRLEMEAKVAIAHKKKPVGLIVAASSLAVLVIGLGIFVYVQKKAAAEEAAANAAKLAALQTDMEDSQKRVDAQVAEVTKLSKENESLLNRLSGETDVAKREAIQKDIARNKARMEAEQAKLERERAAAKAKADKLKEERRKTNCSENDPLCGAR